MLLGNGMYSTNQIFALENQTGTENEAEIEADIEQENKCKKDSDCENENEINNQLNITNITIQPETTLDIVKLVTCESSGRVVECNDLGPEDFQITVTGNNPSPTDFPGSEEGVLVTLGAGDYTVSESFEIPEGDVYATFSGDCTHIGQFSSEGTIAEGETQTCTIENIVDLTDGGYYT